MALRPSLLRLKPAAAALALIAAPVLVGCASSPHTAVAAQKTDAALTGAIAGSWRKPEDRARDGARKPSETLAFFGLKPGMTVVELSPGGGYWTDILAPYLAKAGGTYIAAHNDPVNSNDAMKAAREAFIARLQADPATFGVAQVTAFGPRAGAIAAPGSVDLVLSMRGFHGLRLFNWQDKGLTDIRTALKPGGLLGIEAHRGANAPLDGSKGYLPQQFVIDTVTAAGFELVAMSEINANPKDTADHPFGVWTLPPALRTSAFGQPADPTFDQTKYKAIGESDRMTLLFRKK